MSMSFNEIIPEGKGEVESGIDVPQLGTRYHRYTFPEPIDISKGNTRLKLFTPDVIQAIEENLLDNERFTIAVDCLYNQSVHQSLRVTFETTKFHRPKKENPNFPYRDIADFEYIQDQNTGIYHRLLGFPYLVVKPFNVDEDHIRVDNAPTLSFLFEGSNEYKLIPDISMFGNAYTYGAPYTPLHDHTNKFILSTRALSSLEILVNPHKSNMTFSEA